MTNERTKAIDALLNVCFELCREQDMSRDESAAHVRDRLDVVKLRHFTYKDLEEIT